MARSALPRPTESAMRARIYLEMNNWMDLYATWLLIFLHLSAIIKTQQYIYHIINNATGILENYFWVFSSASRDVDLEWTTTTTSTRSVYVGYFWWANNRREIMLLSVVYRTQQTTSKQPWILKGRIQYQSSDSSGTFSPWLSPSL